jgi:hypothetical protein
LRPASPFVTLAAGDHGLIGIAKPCGGLDQRIQHRLHQSNADRLMTFSHITGRGLIFQRHLRIGRARLQRAIRLRAADRDYRLLGESL